MLLLTLLASVVTMEQMFGYYRDEVTLPRKGYGAEAYTLDAMARSELAPVTVQALTPSLLEQYRDRRLTEVSPATVAWELSLISRVINYGKKHWAVRLPQNPVHAVERPRGAGKRSRRLDAEEEQTILELADKTRGGYLRPCIVLALDAALSRAEVVSLNWPMFDLSVGKLLFKSREIPLSRDTLRELAYLNQESGGTGRLFDGLTGQALHRAFYRVVEHADIEDLTFSDLKYEAVCRMCERGWDEEKVRSVAGITTDRGFDRYRQFLQESVSPSA